jgi:hypothetical protein
MCRDTGVYCVVSTMKRRYSSHSGAVAISSRLLVARVECAVCFTRQLCSKDTPKTYPS